MSYKKLTEVPDYPPAKGDIYFTDLCPPLGPQGSLA